MSKLYQQLAEELTNLFAELPEVEAIALGGSRGQAGGATDALSDIDLYVYTHADIPLEKRQAIVEETGGATTENVGLTYWGPGDEWYNKPTGIEVDMVYFGATWMEEQLIRVMDHHQASEGYTTCFWYTVRHATILYDRATWLTDLQQRTQVAYPDALRQNIINHNHPLLRGIIPAYAHQLTKAVKRGDLVSINHRLAALLACYFDILFALNRQLHPGEKRQLDSVLTHCTLLPHDMAADLKALLLLTSAEVADLPNRVNRLLDHLDEVLAAEGLLS